MRTPSVTEEAPEKDIVGVRVIRERNRLERARASAIDCVVEHLGVHGELARAADIHPKVTRDRAMAIVDAVLAITAVPTSEAN